MVAQVLFLLLLVAYAPAGMVAQGAGTPDGQGGLVLVLKDCRAGPEVIL